MHSGRGWRSYFSMCMGIVLVWSVEVQAVSSKSKATLIDRAGNRYEVRSLTYRDRTELEYYVDYQRRIRPFRELERIRFDGDANDEEQTVVVKLRFGKREVGVILAGGSGMPRSAQAMGRSYASIDFVGVSELGPFSMRLSDVREVIFRHPPTEVYEPEVELRADLISLKGERWAVTDLRLLGQRRFEFSQGRKRRGIDMGKIAEIDLAEINHGVESRPVTVTLWSGKVFQGVVDAGLVRLPGETDRAFYRRREGVLTGRMDSNSFSSGLQYLRLIRFRRPSDEESSDQDKDSLPGMPSLPTAERDTTGR